MSELQAPARGRGIGVCSVLLGLCGLATCWWTPAGMVFSLAGLMLGLVGLVTVRRGARTPAIAGLILSAAALAVCWIIAGWGLEYIRFGH